MEVSGDSYLVMKINICRYLLCNHLKGNLTLPNGSMGNMSLEDYRMSFCPWEETIKKEEYLGYGIYSIYHDDEVFKDGRIYYITSFTTKQDKLLYKYLKECAYIKMQKLKLKLTYTPKTRPHSLRLCLNYGVNSWLTLC